MEMMDTKKNFDINKQRAFQHEINYGMQTIGGPHRERERKERNGGKGQRKKTEGENLVCKLNEIEEPKCLIS
jgi:hypothetical protein